MRLLVYSVNNKNIVANVPIGSEYDNYYDEPLQAIGYNNPPKNWWNFKVIDNELIEMSELEINEINIYNRILSAEERYENEMLGKLMPSGDEIRKAEMTIELLGLLQEVL